MPGMKLTREQREWLALAMVPGVGTAGFIKLLARFKTAGQVLRAGASELSEVAGPKLAERIKAYTDAADVDGQERLMAKCPAFLLTLEDPGYPVLLAEIYDPPLTLFVRGTLPSDEERCVAVVGTRKPTPYGIRMAEKFGRELAARGITVVSGLAAGIDAAAHRGALEAGGRTIAVLGCGVDVAYPRQNEELMEDIARQGAVISQYPMGTQPAAGHFPFRNRIISGLSLGTLVVEAPERSGALITARQAAEQGREVYAVPGPLGVLNSAGPHRLIQEGAKLVTSVDDILVELDLPDFHEEAPAVPEPVVASPVPSPVPTPAATPAQPPPRSEAPIATPTGVEGSILAVLAPDGSFIDEIAARCRLSISEVLSALTLMELKGIVRQFSGKRFAPR
jgi:DNA processing protein